ncbi:MAG: hypothetical protein AAGL99_18410 [Pseudomonadota bacterium]
MAERNAQEELIFQAQALTEGIELLSRYEEILQGLVDDPADEDLQSDYQSLSQRTADLQSRFEPHLSLIGIFAAQMAHFSARLEETPEAPGQGELSAVSNTLANLQSQLRKTHSDIEAFDKWVAADRDDLVVEIAALSEALLNVQRIFEFSNSLRREDPQSEIFRETVIKLLTAAIEELKAPAVSASRLQGITGFLSRIVKKSAEKKLGEGTDAALNEALKQSGKVVEIVKDLPGLDGLL